MVGAALSPDFVITERKMAGMISRGMICGADEIGLSKKESTGIMILEEIFDEEILAAQLGKNLFDLKVALPDVNGKPKMVKLRSTGLEIDNKSATNRPDLFGLIGHAREFATLFDLEFTPINYPMDQLPSGGVQAQVLSKNVLSYHLMKVEGVTPKVSPLGMSLMLEHSGHSARLDLVDITNYVMTECAQPMHVFDADKIEGGIIVRQAHKGETLEALDGKTYTFEESDLVIADEKKVLAIAGVMGGMYSGVTESTQNVYFESAVFDPTAIRLTAQRLAIRTDASTRYEKSLDPVMSKAALARTISLLDFVGQTGKVTGASYYLDESRVKNITLDVPLSFIRSKLGKEIAETEIMHTLTKLGFSPVVNDGVVQVKVPSWRATKDISINEDIVEEIGRVHGYDEIDERAIPGYFDIAVRNHWVELRGKTQDYFSGKGLYEAFNYSFSNEAKDAAILIEGMENAVAIKNAVSEEFTYMRRYMAPLLLVNARENRKQSSRFGFFEIAKVHTKHAENDFSESKRLAGIFVGYSLAEARDMLDGYFSMLLSDAVRIEQGSDTATPYFHPNKSGRYFTADGLIGSFGFIHPRVLENFDLIGNEVIYFDIDIEKIQKLAQTKRVDYLEPTKFPSITRELNFVLPERQNTGLIATMIAEVDPRISAPRVIDVYQDAVKVGVEKKSVTFSFSIQDRTKTITDEEALDLQTRVIDKLENAGYSLRK